MILFVCQLLITRTGYFVYGKNIGVEFHTLPLMGTFLGLHVENWIYYYKEPLPPSLFGIIGKIR